MQRLEQKHLELIRQVNKHLEEHSSNSSETKSLRKRVTRLKRYYDQCPLVYFVSAQLNSARGNYQEAVTDIEQGLYYKTLDDHSLPGEKWEMPADMGYSEDGILKLYAEDIVFFENADKSRIDRALNLYNGFLSAENSNKQQIWARISTLHSRLGNTREALAYLRKAVRPQPLRYTSSEVFDLAFFAALGLVLDSENGAETYHRLNSLYYSSLRLKNPSQEVRSAFLLTLGDVFSNRGNHIDAAICYYKSLEGRVIPVDTENMQIVEAKMKAADSFLEAAKEYLFSDEPDTEMAQQTLGLLLRMPLFRGRHSQSIPSEYARYLHSKREEAYELLALLEPEKKTAYYQKANLETILMSGMRLDEALKKARIDPFVAMPSA